MERFLYQEIATAVEARRNCITSGNTEWFERWTERIEQLVSFLPSGSGWDNATKIDLDASHGDKLVLFGAFHHMDEAGGYDGWTDHTVTVTPSFTGLNIRVSGRNRNDIKEYLHEIFDGDLCMRVRFDVAKDGYVLVTDVPAAS
jgi:hypothetical protein